MLVLRGNIFLEFVPVSHMAVVYEWRMGLTKVKVRVQYLCTIYLVNMENISMTRNKLLSNILT